MSMIDRYRLWRYRRAKFALADARHHLSKWGFANTPSEDAREERRIGRLERKVERMRLSSRASE